jgi:spoIIIJ-associated protein
MGKNAKDILDTMLGYLGFVCDIKEFETPNGLTLQVYTPERERLIGRHGETLEDIQFLLNRLLQAHDKNAARVQVDVEHYREMREDGLVQKVRQLAELVRKTGRPFHLDPMNAYDRRIVHNVFKDDPEVITWSPPDDARIKRITLKKRVPRQEA